MLNYILGINPVNKINDNSSIQNDKSDLPEIEINEMKIAGLSIRTTNEGGKSLKDQPEFWQKFFNNRINEKIINKKYPDEILGIYYDFESDEHGEYNFLIGFEVGDFNGIPNDLQKITVPGGKYKIFKTGEKSGLGDKIYKLWQSIWSSGLKRSYKFDIEEYNINNMFSDNPDIKIYIGIN
jgi:predicted transcriptional regulator YdeE